MESVEGKEEEKERGKRSGRKRKEEGERREEEMRGGKEEEEGERRQEAAREGKSRITSGFLFFLLLEEWHLSIATDVTRSSRCAIGSSGRE